MFIEEGILQDFRIVKKSGKLLIKQRRSHKLKSVWGGGEGGSNQERCKTCNIKKLRCKTCNIKPLSKLNERTSNSAFKVD